MEQTGIFGPFFTVMLLTCVVWIYMYSRRIPFIKSNRLTPEQLTPLEFARLSPPAVANPADNLRNLFETPLLFYALALYIYVTAQVDSLYVVAGWTFALFRIAHSLVHCTVNVVIVRFGLYVVSSLALGFMVVRAAIRYAIV